MTNTRKPPTDAAGGAETTRKLILDLVETPPPKTMADVAAASEVYEAQARGESRKDKPGQTRRDGG